MDVLTFSSCSSAPKKKVAKEHRIQKDCELKWLTGPSQHYLSVWQLLHVTGHASVINCGSSWPKNSTIKEIGLK